MSEIEERVAALEEAIGPAPYDVWFEQDGLPQPGAPEEQMWVSIADTTERATKVDIFASGGPPLALVFDWPWSVVAEYNPPAIRSRKRMFDGQVVTFILRKPVSR